MGHRPLQKMSNLDRAKQFAPFSALKGLERALRAREAQAENRKELTDDAAEDMNGILCTLSPGQTVTVTFYESGSYRSLTGTVEIIDTLSRTMTVEGVKILFSDLYSLYTD